jgi:hypothetical protein
MLRRALAGALKMDIPLDGADMRVLTLLALLALAALATLAAGADTSAMAMVLGAALGMFGMRLLAFLRDPDGTDVPEEARWDGRVRAPGAARAAADAGDPSEDADAAALRAVDAALKGTDMHDNDNKERLQ